MKREAGVREWWSGFSKAEMDGECVNQGVGACQEGTSGPFLRRLVCPTNDLTNDPTNTPCASVLHKAQQCLSMV